MRVWQILAVVAAGIAYALLDPGRFTYALGHATLYLFLPPLLFEAAWNLHFRAIVRQWPAIAVLAGPGVILTALIVAGALAVVRVPFGPALLTGAILSATDPIAVVAVFRRLNIPRTLTTIVECEALFNDAAAVLLYRAVIVALALGAGGSGIALVAVQTLTGAVLAVALGIVIAFGVARALRGNTSAAAQIVVTVLCAYGSYYAAEYLHGSGIAATIACGIALRYFERRWITLNIDRDVARFWDVGALGANVLVFFLVGAGIQIASVAKDPAFVIACIVAIAVSRVVVAGLLLPGGYPREWLDVIRVAGVRGALSLALALALPPEMPYREAIVEATFAVAIATIAAGGLSASTVAARVIRR
jgi:monovalent cation:H+ antiporter, CPA1 family